MRKKTKGRRLPAKSSQGQEELADHSSESIAFVDESSSEVQLQTGKSSEEEEDVIKDDNECVIAVIDKSPAQSKSNTEPDDEDDDVPEDVSWKASKESAIRERTLEKEIVLDAKRKEKQMRIERNERLREQKERKKEREYSKLPVEVLQQVAKQQVAEQQEPQISQPDDTGNHVTFDSSSSEDEDEDKEQPEENEATPEIKVLVLPRETKKPKKIQQSASLFLQEHLFGDRIQRISQVKDSDRKRKYQTLGPALKFSKKSL